MNVPAPDSGIVRRCLAWCGALFLLCSCALPNPADIQWRDPQVSAAWPEPPEPPRIELLRAIAAETDLGPERPGAGFFGWLLGDDDVDRPLVTPYGISADGNGRVWVADPGDGSVKFFDLAARKVEGLYQVEGTGLVSPVDVAYSPATRRLFVSDSGLNTVYILDEDNAFIGTADPPGGFGRPGGMALDSAGRLYVVDVVKGVVAMFGPDGAYLDSFGSAAADNGLFRNPSNVAVDSSGRLYIVDSLRFRVEILSPDGALVNVVGGLGDGPGSFARPRGIAVDVSGHIYVADAAFDNIQIFDLTGNLLLYFGGPGGEPGEFCLPAGLHIDRNDRIYVAESCNSRFQVFQFLPPAE